jgi:hypothetical protein
VNISKVKPSIYTPPAVDPRNQAVEMICLVAFRRMAAVLSPHMVKTALYNDVQEFACAAPSLEEAAGIVQVVIMGIEPEWVSKRFPRTLGVVQQHWNKLSNYCG